MARTEFAKDPVYGFWQYQKLPAGEYARVDLFCRTQSIAKLTGTFLHAPGYDAEVIAQGLVVAESLRRHGIGTKLLQALACLAIEDGVTTLSGNITSPHSLRIMQKIADSEEAITFYDNTARGDYLELPLSSAQAYDSLTKAGAYEVDQENRMLGFDVAVALNSGQRYGLVPPIMLNSARHVAPAYRLV